MLKKKSLTRLYLRSLTQMQAAMIGNLMKRKVSNLSQGFSKALQVKKQCLQTFAKASIHKRHQNLPQLVIRETSR